MDEIINPWLLRNVFIEETELFERIYTLGIYTKVLENTKKTGQIPTIVVLVVKQR